MTLCKQFHQVYNFDQIADITEPEAGQVVVVTQTPDFGPAKIQLITDGEHTIRQLYESWKNGEDSPFRTKVAQDIIDAALQQNIDEETSAREAAIKAEAQTRKAKDIKVLGDAKAYADEQIANAVAATQTWLPAVSDVLPIITDTSKTWLCRRKSNQTVYQCVAGQTEWLPYSDQNDFVNELEMEAAFAEHNGNGTSHEDIRAALSDEVQARQQAISEEAQARIEGDEETLAAAKAHTNAAQMATQTWVPAVKQKSKLDLITGLNNNINYLCRVIADPDPANNGVYQAIAGWTGSPVWTFFSDNQDFIDETELEEAFGAHDENESAHGGIGGIRPALLNEIQQREDADQHLQEQIDNLTPDGMVKLANKKIISQPLQIGTLDIVEQSQIIKNLDFDTQAEVDQSPEGVGYLLLSDGSKLNWDGNLLTLVDAGGNVIVTIYDAFETEKWAIPNYDLAENTSVVEIAVSDRTVGPWPHVTYSYQAPDEYYDFPEHAENQQNPHNVTADQVGTYTQVVINQKIDDKQQELREEIDAKHGAIINLGYTKGYWYGRKNAQTPWPMPADGEIWNAHARKAFCFVTNTIWEWDGGDWAQGVQIPVANGTTIGVSESILDIVDSGFPGKAIYSAQTASWDFYPDKLGMETIQKATIAPGDFGYTAMRNEVDMQKFRMMPADGRTISIHDSRAERLLQYCLIPHAEAVANTDIIGLYRTNENYPDHASWLAANKLRPAPAENGAYLVIPDGCGIFMRGKGQHGGHKAANNTPYDGGNIGAFISDAIRDFEGTPTNSFVVTTGIGATGAFVRGPIFYDQTLQLVNGGNVGYSKDIFAARHVTPVANENRPGSLAGVPYITF